MLRKTIKIFCLFCFISTSFASTDSYLYENTYDSTIARGSYDFNISLHNNEEFKTKDVDRSEENIATYSGWLIEKINDLSTATLKYLQSFSFSKEFIEDKKIIDCLDSQTIPLTNIIESFFSESTIIDLAKEEFTPKEHNKIRTDLAAKWEKNASTRIFHDKMRSFLEAVLNSCDSYSKEETVGKFGMGFFSMLSLLKHDETDGASIVVETCYRRSHQDLHAYKITLDLEEGKIYVHFDSLSTDIFDGKTGTKVSIVPKNSSKEFSENTLYSLLQYMYLLDFHKESYIELYFQPSHGAEESSEKIGESSFQNPYRVVCKLLPQLISSQDFGSGIPIDIALTKLLVPSSSTKSYDPEEIKDLQEKILRDHVPIARFVTARGKKEEPPML